MLIIVHVPASVSIESHRDQQEAVDVDINDTIETVKVKISLIFTSADPDHMILESGGYMCHLDETVLSLKRRVQE